MCERCERIFIAIKAEIHGDGHARSSLNQEEGYTAAGKLIAAGARARGLTVREVSQQVGRPGEYLVRVCKGRLRLTAPTAYAVGKALGIDLLECVIDNKKSWGRQASLLPAGGGQEQEP